MKSDIFLRGDAIDVEAQALTVTNAASAVTVRFDARHGNLTLGGGSADGDLLLTDGAGLTRVHVDGSTSPGSDTVQSHLQPGRLTLGGNGASGIVSLRNRDGASRITLAGQRGTITCEDIGVDTMPSLNLFVFVVNKAIKDMKTRIDALEAEIAALKS